MHSLATRMRKMLFSSVLREVPVVEESGVCRDAHGMKKQRSRKVGVALFRLDSDEECNYCTD
jgi:hypothetical protein